MRLPQTATTSLRNDTRLVGNGPATFSTDTAVEPYPSIVYDTNAYYASLGVTHRATRGELKRAYQHRQGHRSARLTYILSQLLDPKVRRAYDATPLGSLFLDDFVAADIRRQSAKHHRRFLQMGIKPPAGLLDFDEMTRHTLPVPPMTSHTDTETESTWDYSYYLRGDADFHAVSFGLRNRHHRVLRRWQALLVEAFARQGLRLALGVGLDDLQHGVHVTAVGYRTVVFIHPDETPTEALADRVASALSGVTHGNVPNRH